MDAPALPIEISPLLQQVLGAAIELLEADRATIHLGDPGNGSLRIAEQIGFGREPLAPPAFDHDGRVVVADVLTDPRLGGVGARYLQHGIRSYEAVALLGSAGQRFGLLSIYRERPHQPSERELKLLDVFRLQVERAVEGKRAEEALRRNETGLRLALDAGQMGSFEWNIQTGEIRWSDNLEAIHGLAPGTFSGTFQSFQALIHPEDREGVLQTIRDCIETGADYEAEFRSAAHGGRAHWIMGKGKVLKDDQGRPWRMMGVCMDITRRKHAEEAIRESDRRKDEFLAMISHELRNPLSAIVSASALLEGPVPDDPASSTSSRALAVIRRQTEQLTRIVNDLLDIARLTTGKMILQGATLDLAALVGRCLEELAGAHWLDLHHPELQLSRALVHGDSVRLEQVVTNLLTNAVKYTPANGTISVEVAPVGEEAVLRVRDTGVGIAPELLPRIFDLFVQSERGLDRRDGGLGVGLCIVRRLVEAHGGRVEARSPGPNRGTEIVVRFPLAAELAAPSEAAVRPAPLPGRRRILVIDDNTDAREGLVALLELAGHEVHEAADGPTGLESVSRLQPDTVLVDIGLPGLDGFELARELRARGSNVRLIALTGYGHPEYRRRGAEAGFDAYLVKPVELEAVLDELPPD